MRLSLFFALCMAFLNVCFSANEVNMTNAAQHPIVLFKTTMGDFKVELYPEKAPVTVKNFLEYVKSGQYNNTIFHRVINGFMIQGGGFTKEMKQKPTNAPIQNEAENGLKNDVGTIAMARTSDVNSATTQFFINVNNNDFLNFRSKKPSEYGYAVFGKVIEGMDVVDAIKKVQTGNNGPYSDVPKVPVEILEANVVQ